MKRVFAVFGFAFLIIAACMIYLVHEGVSLRTEPLIKPSPIDSEYQNIAYGIVHRLFANFQNADYVVWGVNPPTAEEAQILAKVQAEYAAQYKVTPTVLNWGEIEGSGRDEAGAIHDEALKKCSKPCWILVDKDKAHEMSANAVIEQIKNVLGPHYFSISFLDFDLNNKEVPAECENEKRLDYACVLPVSVREVRRRMKDGETRYFFMRRYNEKDHFLFLEKAPVSPSPN